jgi:hypothetical protein
MPTIAIVGGGPGMGLPVARVYRRNGFAVALVAAVAQDQLGRAIEGEG